MSPNPMRCTFAAGAAVALAMLVSPAVGAETPVASAASQEKPVIVAQVPGSAGAQAMAPGTDAYPAYQRGVRAAAAEGPEALRRYVWRTRMIYNFRYQDFAPKE
jgi:hypothetical protein